MRKRAAASLLLGLVSSLLLSCVQSRIHNKWVDPDYPTGPLQKMLVLALWEDGPSRWQWEETFREKLHRSGGVAVASHRYIDETMPDSATVFTMARQQGCDGVVVVYQALNEWSETYIPPRIERVRVPDDGYRVQPFDPEQDERESRVIRMPGERFAYCAYDRDAYVDRYYPGYYVRRLESSLCDVEVWTASEDVRMVWSGTTEVLRPEETPRTRDIIAGWIEYEMLACGLLRDES